MAKAAAQVTPLLMPKATSVWLIENSALTFRQIAEFTGITEIEVEALANEEIGKGLVGRDPVDHGETTKESLEKCEADPACFLIRAKSDLPGVKARSKGPRYTPVSKRGDKPDAIAFILKNNPEISDAQICKLVGTTKPTIASIRDRAHPNTPNLRPRHPADLGLCTYQEFEKAYNKGLKAAGKDPEAVRAQREAELINSAVAAQEEDTSTGSGMGGFDFSNFMPDVTTNSDDN
ncbi:MAG: cell cycle transcriptional regulator TrcR [Alphaproteobacteria bacterium]